jgi:hypothetical protein
MSRFAFRPSAAPPQPAARAGDEAPSVSASQFKDFTRCQRLWWFHKVAGVKQREKQHFIVGHCLHERAETYQIGKPGDLLFPPGWDKGLEDDQREWVKDATDKAISLGLWERIPGRLVEFPVCMLVGHNDHQGMPLLARAETYLDPKGVRKIHAPTALINGEPLPRDWNRLPHYNGFMDFFDQVLPEPLIGDHKSAKSRRYALTPEKLACDVQMTCYSAAALALMPEAKAVRLRHNVFLKDPCAPEPAYAVNARVVRDEVARHWINVTAWSVRMSELRSTVPAGEGDARADNWHKVKSAIEDGNSDECRGYGGCTFRDVCFGRCTAAQLLARLDAPDPMKFVKPIEKTYSLRPPTKEIATMAFNKPATPTFAAGQDVYVLDPENATIQYRARIDVLDAPANPQAPGAPPESSIVLWPDADVEPNFGSLGIAYRICIPKSALMGIPLATAKVTGYMAAAQAAGITEGLEWSPAANAPSVAVPAVETAKVPEKPAKDDKYALRAPGHIPPNPQGPLLDPPPATTPVNPAVEAGLVFNGAGTKVGDMLVVARSTHTFWAKLEGKAAKVCDITAGDAPGTVLFSVEIEGAPYEHVLASRFQVPTNSYANIASANLGKIVHLVLDKGALTINAAVEAIYNDGFMILAGTRKVAWDDIVSMEAFDEKIHVPERQPTKEEKAEAKAAAKEEKAAAKTAAKAAEGLATTPIEPTTPAAAVAQAITLCEEALKAGKVTRKIIEAVLPLLKVIQAGGGLENGLPITVPAPAAGAGDPVVRGVVKVALTHAIGVLNEALGKIGE